MNPLLFFEKFFVDFQPEFSKEFYTQSFIKYSTPVFLADSCDELLFESFEECMDEFDKGEEHLLGSISSNFFLRMNSFEEIYLVGNFSNDLAENTLKYFSRILAKSANNIQLDPGKISKSKKSWERHFLVGVVPDSAIVFLSSVCFLLAKSIVFIILWLKNSNDI